MLTKKMNFGLLMLMVLILLSSCTDQQQYDDSTRIINASGDLQNHFNTIEDLVTASRVIVEVKVKESETIVYGDLPFTISTAEVKQSVKGSFNNGDTINILETGGKYHPIDKNNKVSEEEYELVFENVKVMNTSDTYFVFLGEYVGPIAKNSFVIKGVYQGKFNVQDNMVTQQTPDKHEKKAYSNPQTLEDFVKKIKDITENE